MCYQIIPEVEYRDIANGLDSSAVEQIKASGTVVVRGVVPEQKVSVSRGFTAKTAKG